MYKLVSLFSNRALQIVASVLFSWTFSLMGFAQGDDNHYNENIIPPPPNSYSFVKYIDHPISHNTGVPEVSIPLFSWGNRSGLDLNLSMSYHLGGIKVEEVASNVGLGWSLQGLGVITRSMRSRSDDGPNGFINSEELPNYNTIQYDGDFPSYGAYTGDSPHYLLSGMGLNPNANFHFLHSLFKNYHDAQQDVFYLSVAGLALKFYIGKDKSILFEEYSNTIITPRYNSYGWIESFEVIDAQGVKYIFEEQEITRNIDSDGAFEPVPDYTSSWLLTKIESPVNQDEIKIEYESYTQSYVGGFSETLRVRTTDSEYSHGPKQTIERSSRNIGVIGKRVKKVSLPDAGSISFVYDSTPRIDVGYLQNDYGRDHRLQRIDFFNKYNSTPLYSYELIHSYFTKPNFIPGSISAQYSNRLKLDGLKKIKDGISEEHQFEYFSDKIVPRNSNYLDFWGYAITDGRSMPNRIPEIKNPSLLPYSNIYRGVDRSTDPIGVLSGSLKKIIYPTKGYTVFNMEANEAFGVEDFFTNERDFLLSFDQSNSSSTPFLSINFSSVDIGSHYYWLSLKETFREAPSQGGYTWLEDHLNNTPIQVRIRKIDNSWSKVLYSGKYEQFINGSVIKIFNESVPSAGNYRLEVILGNFTPYPIQFEGKVELKSISNAKESKIVGGLRAESIQYHDVNSQLLLKKSYNYDLLNGESAGKIGNIPNYNFYRFSVYIFEHGIGEVPVFVPKATEHWLHRNSSPTIDLGYISSTPVLYTQVEEIIEGVNQEGNGSILYEFHPFTYYQTNQSYIYPFDPGIVDVWTSGKSKKTTYRDVSGSNVMTKSYEYNNELSKVEQSKHRSLKIGVASGSDALGDAPQETRQFSIYSIYPHIGHSRLKKETTTMHFKPNIVIGPTPISRTDSIQTMIEYTYDSKKQLKREKQTDGQGMVTTSVLYYPYEFNLPAYNSLVLSNRIESYVQKDILKGSFTDPSARIREIKNYKLFGSLSRYEGTYLNYQEGASFPDIIPSLLDSPLYIAATKVLSYDSYGNPQEIKANGLHSVYLWGYGGQYPVARIDNATHAEVVSALLNSNWAFTTVYAALNQTNVSDATINNYALGIRKNLSKAKVTSITYRPLIGVTSITDAQGIAEYYHYDGFGRLRSVVDQDQNTIRTYCYNYIGQQVDCTL